MNDARPMITVEFYGVPRARAGRPAAEVKAATIADVLVELDERFPDLHCLGAPVCRLNPHYLLSLNGERFASALDTAVRPGDRLLLLSADVGG